MGLRNILGGHHKFDGLYIAGGHQTLDELYCAELFLNVSVNTAPIT